MFKRIVTALVATPEGSRAVERAVDIAVESRADLHFIVITPPHGVTEAFASLNGPVVARMVAGDREHSLDAKQEQVLSFAKSKGLSPTVQHVDDDLVESVLEILKRQKADLLVLGLRRSGSSLSRVWSKVGELADETPCCILGVP